MRNDYYYGTPSTYDYHKAKLCTHCANLNDKKLCDECFDIRAPGGKKLKPHFLFKKSKEDRDCGYRDRIISKKGLLEV